MAPARRSRRKRSNSCTSRPPSTYPTVMRKPHGRSSCASCCTQRQGGAKWCTSPLVWRLCHLCPLESQRQVAIGESQMQGQQPATELTASFSFNASAVVRVQQSRAGAAQRPMLAVGGALAVLGPTTSALGGGRTLRGCAGTEKMCKACHWLVKGASEHGVVHGKGGACTWAGGQLPCGACAQPMAEHEKPCVRGPSFQPKSLSELGA